MARKVNESNEEDVDPQLQVQSRELYANFVREEIHLQGLSVPSEAESFVPFPNCTKTSTFSSFLSLFLTKGWRI